MNSKIIQKLLRFFGKSNTKNALDRSLDRVGVEFRKFRKECLERTLDRSLGRRLDGSLGRVNL